MAQSIRHVLNELSTSVRWSYNGPPMGDVASAVIDVEQIKTKATWHFPSFEEFLRYMQRGISSSPARLLNCILSLCMYIA